MRRDFTQRTPSTSHLTWPRLSEDAQVDQQAQHAQQLVGLGSHCRRQLIDLRIMEGVVVRFRREGSQPASQPANRPASRPFGWAIDGEATRCAPQCIAVTCTVSTASQWAHPATLTGRGLLRSASATPSLVAVCSALELKKAPATPSTCACGGARRASSSGSRAARARPARKMGQGGGCSRGGGHVSHNVTADASTAVSARQPRVPNGAHANSRVYQQECGANKQLPQLQGGTAGPPRPS